MFINKWLKERLLGQSFSSFVCVIVTFGVHISPLLVLFVLVVLWALPSGNSSAFPVMRHCAPLPVNEEASSPWLLVQRPGGFPFFSWKWPQLYVSSPAEVSQPISLTYSGSLWSAAKFLSLLFQISGASEG